MSRSLNQHAYLPMEQVGNVAQYPNPEHRIQAYPGTFEHAQPAAGIPYEQLPDPTLAVGRHHLPVSQDKGNSSAHFIRTSIQQIPANQKQMCNSGIPLCVVVSPFADQDPTELKPPIVYDTIQKGPLRCAQCQAFMNPLIKFQDDQFLCPMCRQVTRIPPEYPEYLQQYCHAELNLGTYEFAVPSQMCRNQQLPKNPASFIFIIDASQSSVRSQLLSLLCANMKTILSSLPVEGDQRARVAFITFDNQVHFYNIQPFLSNPQMFHVAPDDISLPLRDGLLVDSKWTDLMGQLFSKSIPERFSVCVPSKETILAPAIEAGIKLLSSSGGAGKLLVFLSSNPTGQGAGQVKPRTNMSKYGTDDEKEILIPQTPFYAQLGAKCVQDAGGAVDLFIFDDDNIDLATIGQLASETGGQIRKYPSFGADQDGDRLVQDVQDVIRSTSAFDIRFSVWTSAGIRIHEELGHFLSTDYQSPESVLPVGTGILDTVSGLDRFFLRSSKVTQAVGSEIHLGAMDSGKAITLELEHERDLSETNAYLQIAVLYTSVGGWRRVRILNRSWPVCRSVVDMYDGCDVGVIMNLFLKQSVSLCFTERRSTLRKYITDELVMILDYYRDKITHKDQDDQLIWPQSLRLLPLYTMCMLRSDALGRPGLKNSDRRLAMYNVMTMNVDQTTRYLYPRLTSVSSWPSTAPDGVGGRDLKMAPAALRCRRSSLSPAAAAYLLDNGVQMFLYVGRGWTCPAGLFMTQIVQDSHRMEELSSASQASLFARNPRITLVHEGEQHSVDVFNNYLVEDERRSDPSYAGFMNEMQHAVKEYSAGITWSTKSSLSKLFKNISSLFQRILSLRIAPALLPMMQSEVWTS